MVKVFHLLRTHWKKTTFASGALAYGVNYGIDSYERELMMRNYCESAAQIGDMKVTSESDMRRITVILNPAANKRKAKKNFEKYCAPLLHLSGAYVTIIETEGEGHAKKLAEQIDPISTCVVVAGGDGTFSETITGLMRSRGELCRLPIGFIPLGRYNTLASQLFYHGLTTDAEKVASATMAVISGKTKTIPAYRVESLSGSSEKPIYGVGWLEWGSWPLIKKSCQRLWYTGPARWYIPLLFPPQKSLNSEVLASLRFTEPCSGCSKCFSMRPDLSNALPNVVQSNRWWAAFAKKPLHQEYTDYNAIENSACNKVHEKTIKTTDIRLSTDLIFPEDTTSMSPAPKLILSIGPEKRYYGAVVVEGMKYLNGEPLPHTDLIVAKQLEIRPTEENKPDDSNKMSDQESLLIDNEDYEVRPMRITVLPNSLTVFCSA